MAEEINGHLNFGWMHDVEITDGAIKSSFPLEKLLNNSVYYPGAGFDGRPVQWLHRLFQSFVYVDYGVRREHLLGEIEDPRTGFRGYRLAGSREIEERELVPQGWRPPQEILELAVSKGASAKPVYGNAPFAEWLLFDPLQPLRRLGPFTAEIGAESGAGPCSGDGIRLKPASGSTGIRCHPPPGVPWKTSARSGPRTADHGPDRLDHGPDRLKVWRGAVKVRTG
jgi:hypothetical protein